MSTLIRALLALGFGFGVNLAVAQNAEWAEGKYPGHDREYSKDSQGQSTAPGGLPQPDKSQSTDDQSQKEREHASPETSAVRKQPPSEYPKSN